MSPAVLVPMSSPHRSRHQMRPAVTLYRLGSLAFRYGEQFYHFQGLRQFKEKFHPEWRPKYLVYPGGVILPRVLTNVTALVSGGLRRIVRP